MTKADRPTPIPPPAPDEYDDYYGRYVDKVDLKRPILDLLEVQHQEIQTLLAALKAGQGSFRYAPGKWSIKEVVGHLIDTERIFAYRGLCFARGEEQALPGMDQDEYVAGGDFDQRIVSDLADEYKAARRSTITQFGGFSPQQLDRRGIASGCEFTARATVFIIAGHERHHLGVLRRLYGL